MASLYRRGEWFWIAYYANGEHVQRALGTNDARIAKQKKKQIEYELSIGELQAASHLPIGTVLQQFCEHLQATRTFKSRKNDVSRLRVFFGPICEALELGIAGGWSKTKTPKRPADRYADAHVKVELLEDVSPVTINQFIATRIRDDGWSPKTANSTRQVLHRLFVYATKHHGFRARDRRYPNPADGVERQHEAAPEIRFLSLQQVEEQLEALAPNPLMHAMVAASRAPTLIRAAVPFSHSSAGTSRPPSGRRHTRRCTTTWPTAVRCVTLRRPLLVQPAPRGGGKRPLPLGHLRLQQLLQSLLPKRLARLPNVLLRVRDPVPFARGLHRRPGLPQERVVLRLRRLGPGLKRSIA